jgi:hypothetical protein
MGGECWIERGEGRHGAAMNKTSNIERPTSSTRALPSLGVHRERFPELLEA